MSLFHLTTPEIEAEAIRLLTELAERKHAGDCDAVHVQFVCESHVAGGMLFHPREDKLVAPTADQARHERDALAYWLAVVPDLDNVTVVVRRYGKVVRTALLEPPLVIRPCGASARPDPETEG